MNSRAVSAWWDPRRFIAFHRVQQTGRNAHQRLTRRSGGSRGPDHNSARMRYLGNELTKSTTPPLNRPRVVEKNLSKKVACRAGSLTTLMQGRTRVFSPGLKDRYVCPYGGLSSPRRVYDTGECSTKRRPYRWETYSRKTFSCTILLTRRARRDYH